MLTNAQKVFSITDIVKYIGNYKHIMEKYDDDINCIKGFTYKIKYYIHNVEKRGR